jgi:hypothetical protein
MRRISTKGVVAVVAGTALVATGAGVAYAYWTATGTGSGSATTSTGAPDLSFGGTTALNAMYPGDTPQGFSVDLTNNAQNKAYVAGVKAYLTIDSSHATAGCSAADYVLGADAQSAAAAPASAATAIPLTFTAAELASGGKGTVSGAIGFNDQAGSNQDACKGASVTINYLAG